MSDAPKKVSTKIWRPILEKLERKMDASCLRRDAYLSRVLAVELNYLDSEVALPNSIEAKEFIAERLDGLADRKLVSLSLRPDIVERLNDLCERKRIVRDAFFNRLFLLLAAPPKALDRLLFNGDSTWRADVWREFDHGEFGAQTTFYPLEQEIDPFWALRAGLDICSGKLDLDDYVVPGSAEVIKVIRTVSDEIQLPPRIYTTVWSDQEIKDIDLFGFNCHLPTWRIPNHPDELASRQRLDDILALL